MHNAHYGVKREMCEKHIIFDAALATCESWGAEKQEAPAKWERAEYLYRALAGARRRRPRNGGVTSAGCRNPPDTAGH